MNSKNIVKVDLLRRKINEYFSKHPKSKSVVIKSKVGNITTHWKVVKENKNYTITEVNSSKSKFIIEVDTAVGGKGATPYLYDPDTAIAKQATPTKMAPPPRPSTTVRKMSQQGLYLPQNIAANARAWSEDEFRKVYGMTRQSALKQYTGRKLPNIPIAEPSDIQAVPPPLPHKLGTQTPPPLSQKYIKTSTGMPKYIGQESALPAQKNPFEKNVSQSGFSNPLKKQQFKKMGQNHGDLPIEPVNEASIEFTSASRDFVNAMTPPFDHGRLSNALKNLNTKIARIRDPKEKSDAGSMIGVLTQLVDSTTAQTGSRLRLASKKYKGKKIREQEEEPIVPQKEEEPKKEDEPKKKGDVKKVVQEPEREPDQKEPEQQQTKKSSEEIMFKKALAGNIIEDISFKPKDNGGEVHIKLANTNIPIILKWEGKKFVVYIQNTPYFLRR